MVASNDYIRRIEMELERERSDLEPFLSGQMHIGERRGNEPWRDTTQAWIASRKRIIATYETILEALRKRQVP